MVAALKKNVEPYNPNWMLPGPWFKILLTFRSGIDISVYRREVFTYSDGGKTNLDFYPKKKSSPTDLENKPLIIFLGGFMGGSNDRYLFEPLRELHKHTGI